ncbi:peptidylprolyl isomerase [Flavobacterium salilacus subsp. salilacus]|uniref:peptidylprolyl isomerase n=1 Tax=Flavobacterium TaxID=237 RepID=UPI0010753635|nr:MULTISPECIES: peptidylprolyl isomerase [Flavobacterium]KAF2519487.1 peptidylprolyl isomerase [Flavobacterium salilacus subsp. salilacus]MBE1614616.1 peptidylprolyl isomerase [Flavobacterium sp. SaA2.13]NDI98316.1 peptidylprolyl isomerase [Flavobacterium salilacus subsp. altitudinum]
MKFISSRIQFVLAFLFLAFAPAKAQEIIKETETDTVKPAVAKPTGRIKVDGIVAVVGDYVVLDSDIDLMYRELQAQNVPIKDVKRCELLGKLMEDKLYAHQAIQDSIIVTDAEVKETMSKQIDYFVEQIGSEEKMVSYFKKKDIDSFKAELSEMIKTQKLTEQMQKKIIDEVTITPEEVRIFFSKFKGDEIPVFGAEMEVAQIVIKPEISQEEKQKVIDRLKEIKNDVLQNGASFYSKAVLYSEDPGSRSNGGYYKMTRKTPFVKEFKDAAFSLDEGEISEPVETEFGYHLIYVEKIRGQELDVRHILMKPKVSNEALSKAKDRTLQIRQRIQNGEISFAEAARSESDEKETKNSGGLLLNPRTLETRFELTKLPPEIYSDVVDLKEGEITPVLLNDDPATGKSWKIMTVTNRYNEHTADYALDYTKIKDLALKEKQIQAIAKWSDEKIKETYVKVSPEYRDCDFANNWVK